MSSLNKISAIKALNKGNFVDSEFSMENREFVMWFRNRGVKIPDGCCMMDGYIYDMEDEIKICRVLIGSK